MTRPPPPALPPGHEPIVYATREEAREAALAEARRIHYEEEVLDRSYDIVTRPPRTKPMPSFPEPSRNKTHWDHLLEEMKWLAGDFVRERKFRMKLAKKAAHAVARSNLDLESRVIKRRLDEAAAARKKARRVASEVMQFWIKIEKVVRFKAQSAIDSKRKEVMDKHLDFMMQQTERYSTMLATKLGGDADADAANANANAKRERERAAETPSGAADQGRAGQRPQRQDRDRQRRGRRRRGRGGVPRGTRASSRKRTTRRRWRRKSGEHARLGRTRTPTKRWRT